MEFFTIANAFRSRPDLFQPILALRLLWELRFHQDPLSRSASNSGPAMSRGFPRIFPAGYFTWRKRSKIRSASSHRSSLIKRLMTASGFLRASSSRDFSPDRRRPSGQENTPQRQPTRTISRFAIFSPPFCSYPLLK